MQPVIVMPMNDPERLFFPHLQRIKPELESVFERAFLSVPLATAVAQADYVDWIKGDAFFHMLVQETAVTVGEDFLSLYAFAAQNCHPDQVLHLCFVDRVAYAVQSVYREQFFADIRTTSAAKTPLIFQRSSAAWATHPRNYYQIETIVRQVGELLFKRSLDFGWCHLALTAQQLGAVVPLIQSRELSMMAEFPLLLRESLQTQDVDWLAWEDPFILNCDAAQLKRERENSLAETQKRLSYALPMMEILADTSREHKRDLMW